jgi:hypothetical protein
MGVCGGIAGVRGGIGEKVVYLVLRASLPYNFWWSQGRFRQGGMNHRFSNNTGLVIRGIGLNFRVLNANQEEPDRRRQPGSLGWGRVSHK